MIDKVDKRLATWVISLIQNATVSFTPPKESPTGRGVNMFLLELVETPPLRGQKRTPLQLSLRYLVTSWDETPEKAHEILGQIVFATMQHNVHEVVLEPVPAELWIAFGINPQPSF